MNNDISKKTFLQVINYNLTPTELIILNYVLLFSLKNNFNYVSQLRIAKYVGKSVRTVQRTIRKLYILGIITYKKQRGFNQSNLYRFNKLIFKLKSYFYGILPSLKWCKKALHKATNFNDVALCLQGRRIIYSSCKTIIERVTKTLIFSDPLSQRPSGDGHQETLGHLGRPGCSRDRGCFRPLRGNRESGVFPRTRVGREKIPQNKEIVMERSQPKLSSIVITVSKELNLTLAGQLKLLVLPDRALEETFKEYKRRSYLPQPFFWFLHYAKQWCTDHNVQVDYSLWNTLKKQYNIPDKPEWVKKPQAPKLMTHKIFQNTFTDEPKSEQYKQQQADLIGKAIQEDPKIAQSGFQDFLQQAMRNMTT